MGAINFYGGTWCGGGAGLCLDGEFEVQPYCTMCGELEEDCACEEEDRRIVYRDTIYESDVFEWCGKNIDVIQEEILRILGENDKFLDVNVIRKGKNTTRTLSLARFMRMVVKSNCEIFTLKAGYYKGFQIFTDFYNLWRFIEDYSDFTITADDNDKVIWFTYDGDLGAIADMLNDVISKVNVFELMIKTR